MYDHWQFILFAKFPGSSEDTDEKVAMDTSSSKEVAKHSSKSLKSQHGNYPKWMSNRKIQQAKTKGKGKKMENKINKRKKRNYL